MKAKDYIQSEAEHLCLYGDPGTGKSTLVVELLNHGYKLKYFCIDGGIPLKGLSPEALDNLEVFMLLDTPGFPVGIQTCRAVIKGTEVQLCDYHGQLNCSVCRKNELTFSRVCLNELALNEIAVFDHLSGLSDSAMNMVFDGDKALNAGTKADDKAGYTEYRQMGFQLQDFLSRQQIAKFNTICISHQLIVDMEDGKKKIVPQVGTRDFASAAGKYFGHLIHSSVQNKSHRFGSSSVYMNSVLTKSRSGITIEGMTVPSLKDFFVPANVGKDIRPAIIKSAVPSTHELKSLVDMPIKSNTLQDLKSKLAAKK